MRTSTIVLIVATLALLGLTLNIGYNIGYSKVKETLVEHTDTIYHTDTFTIEKPTPEYVYLKELIEVPVTMFVHDTTYVTIPIEVKIYQDSTYKAQVSGYRANLDWIEVYQKTRDIKTIFVEPRKKFGFSVGVGPAVIYSPFHNGIDAGVGVFAGLTYTF